MQTGRKKSQRLGTTVRGTARVGSVGNLGKLRTPRNGGGDGQGRIPKRHFYLGKEAEAERSAGHHAGGHVPTSCSRKTQQGSPLRRLRDTWGRDRDIRRAGETRGAMGSRCKQRRFTPHPPCEQNEGDATEAQKDVGPLLGTVGSPATVEANAAPSEIHACCPVTQNCPLLEHVPEEVCQVPGATLSDSGTSFSMGELGK